MKLTKQQQWLHYIHRASKATGIPFAYFASMIRDRGDTKMHRRMTLVAGETVDTGEIFDRTPMYSKRTGKLVYTSQTINEKYVSDKKCRVFRRARSLSKTI